MIVYKHWVIVCSNLQKQLRLESCFIVFSNFTYALLFAPKLCNVNLISYFVKFHSPLFTLVFVWIAENARFSYITIKSNIFCFFQYLQPWAQFCCKMWGVSLIWNQCIHLVDAELKFYKYRFSILFLEFFRKQHYSRFVTIEATLFNTVYPHTIKFSIGSTSDFIKCY